MEERPESPAEKPQGNVGADSERADMQIGEIPLPPTPALPELPKPPAPNVRLPKPRNPGSSSQAEEYRRMGVAYTIPIALIAPVIVLTLAGTWLDKKLFGGGSGLTIGGAILGLVVGVRNVISMVSRLDK
jgi:F0F1-type ATP synthase assembly protein I